MFYLNFQISNLLLEFYIKTWREELPTIDWQTTLFLLTKRNPVGKDKNAKISSGKFI